MKLPKVGSKWVCLVDEPQGADVKQGDIVEVESVTGSPMSKYVGLYYRDCIGTGWGATLEFWHENFKPLHNEKDPQPEKDRRSNLKEIIQGVEVDLEKSLEEQSDNVNHPAHYGQGNIEAIEYIEDFLTKEEYIGYLRGNIAKYLHRWRYKNGEEDLEKAQWYLDKLIGVVNQ